MDKLSASIKRTNVILPEHNISFWIGWIDFNYWDQLHALTLLYMTSWHSISWDRKPSLHVNTKFANEIQGIDIKSNVSYGIFSKMAKVVYMVVAEDSSGADLEDWVDQLVGGTLVAAMKRWRLKGAISLPETWLGSLQHAFSDIKGQILQGHLLKGLLSYYRFWKETWKSSYCSHKMRQLPFLWCSRLAKYDSTNICSGCSQSSSMKLKASLGFLQNKVDRCFNDA